MDNEVITTQQDLEEQEYGNEREENQSIERNREDLQESIGNERQARKSEEEGEEDNKGNDEQEREVLAKEQIDAFIKQWDLPKGTDYIIDKNNQLKFIVPINGVKYQVSPAEIIQGFNLNQAGYQKLEQGKQIEKQVKTFFDHLKNNPKQAFGLLGKLGVPRQQQLQIAKEMLEEAVNEANMTPEEKEMFNFKKTKEQELKELEQIRAEKQRLKEQEVVEKYKNDLAKQIPDVMNKHGFKSSSQGVKSKVLYDALGLMNNALANGHNITLDEAVFRAKQNWQQGLMSYFNELDDNHINKLIPERIRKAIRQSDLKNLMDVTPTSKVVDQRIKPKPVETQPRQANKKQTASEYFESLMRI